MSKSIKFKDGSYLDSSGIVHKDMNNVRKTLKDILFHVSGGGEPNDCNAMLENGTYMWGPDSSNKPPENFGTIFTTVSYGLKGSIENLFPLKSGHTRKVKICIDATDNKQSGADYIRLSYGGYAKEYLFGVTWGNVGDGIRQTKVLDFDYAGLPYGHMDIYITPDFATGGSIRIYRVWLQIFDIPN